ncbi:hypothetical protein GQ54DRAFT_296552 [Martensiomyces pterosporus]|nr:hypothetical protein GQ54DRAFT_296552 [Martensiomyces pterosporus]
MSLEDYLAKNYGSVSERKGAKKKSKHEKHRKHQPTHGMSIIVDDDDSIFSTAQQQRQHVDTAEITAEQTKPRFKSASSSWRTVRDSKTNPIDEMLDIQRDGLGAYDNEERPAIADGAELLQEYAEKRQEEERERQLKELEARELEKEECRRRIAQEKQAEADKKSRHASEARKSRSPSPGSMRYGLQTADVIKEDADRARERYMRKLRETADSESGRDAKTVYRDAKTGRRINIEAARKDEEEKRREKEKRQLMQTEWNKGLVQQRQKTEEQKRIESMRRSGEGFTVYADSGEIDAEKRAKQHWDDPALKFLESKKTAASKYPEYKGNAPPNRFDIRPGYRWDGVDRSNGYEVSFFKRQAGSSAQRAEEYAYAVADW